MNLVDSLYVFDPNSLYPSAMALINSIQPKIEKKFVYIKVMNNKLVNSFKGKNFGIEKTHKIQQLIQEF